VEVEEGSQFTTFCAWRAGRSDIIDAIFNRRERAARVAQAKCGVMRQFLAVSSGLSARGGSVDSTSRAAPARRLEFKASARAGSSTRGPRLVLRRKAVGFISDRRRASTRFAVCGVSGQWRLTTSLSRRAFRDRRKRTPGGAGPARRVAGQQFHAEGRAQLTHRPANAAKAYDAEGESIQFEEREIPVAPLQTARPAPSRTVWAWCPACWASSRSRAKVICATDFVP